MSLDISTFSDRQLAGQRLMVGFEGQTLNDDLKYLIGSLKIGSVILFAINLASPDQITRLCSDIQAFARSTDSPPLFIAIDQEGGQVARLKEPFTRFAGNAAMKTTTDAENFGRITASELKQIGVNMDMAPVVDVAPDDLDSIMAQRSFGSDPHWVAKMGGIVIDQLQTQKVMAVAKHFPGIGRTTLDSHLDMPTLSASEAQLDACDLIPFEAAARRKVAGMMLSHIYYDRIDPKWPASLSPRIAHDMLRVKLGYEGVVMTDDLDMGAIRKHFDTQTAIGQVLAADIDLALICHKGPDIETAYAEILRQIKSAPDMKKRTIASVERIMRLKREYLEE